MKTIIFEKILLSLDDSAYTIIKSEGHEGSAEIRVSPTELDVFVAELINHRKLVEDKLKELKAQENLKRELMKKA